MSTDTTKSVLEAANKAKKTLPPEGPDMTQENKITEAAKAEAAKKAAENAKKAAAKKLTPAEEAAAEAIRQRNKKAMLIGLALVVVLSLLLALSGFPLLLPAAAGSIVFPITGFITGFGGLGVFIALLTVLMLPQGVYAALTAPQKVQFVGGIIKAVIYAGIAFCFPYFVLPFLAGLLLPVLGAGVPSLIITIVGGLAKSGFWAGASVLAYLGIAGTGFTGLKSLLSNLGLEFNMKGAAGGGKLFTIKKGSVLEQVVNIGFGRSVEILVGSFSAAFGIMVLIGVAGLLPFALPFAFPLVGAILMTAIGSSLALGLISGIASFFTGPKKEAEKNEEVDMSNVGGLTPPNHPSPSPTPQPAPGNTADKDLQSDVDFSNDVAGNLEADPKKGTAPPSWGKPGIKPPDVPVDNSAAPGA